MTVERVERRLPAQEPMRFETWLTGTVAEIVQECVGARVLIVCSTQRSARETASAVASNRSDAARHGDIDIHNQSVACVHGGMDMSERQRVEAMFQSGAVSVLCVIGTGLILRNNPAQTGADIVILKGGHKYVGNSLFVPYTDEDRNLFMAHASLTYIELLPDADITAAKRGIRPKQHKATVRKDVSVKASAKGIMENVRTHAEIMELAAKEARARLSEWQGRDGAIQDLWKSEHVRFPPGTEEFHQQWAKVSVTAQAAMAGAVHSDWPRAFQSDCRRAATAMAAAIGKLSLSLRNGTSRRNALELQGALSACAWHDDPVRVLAQIDGVGKTYAQTLHRAGLCDFASIVSAGPGRVQALVGRNPPFGAEVVRSAENMPILDLTAAIVEDDSLSIELTYAVSRCDAAHLLVVVDDRAVLDRSVPEGAGRTSVRIFKKTRRVVASLMSARHAGVNVHRVIDRGPEAEIRPTKRRRQTTVDEYAVDQRSSGANEQTSEKKVPCDGCRHRCADRQTCGHACCKTGAGVLGNHAALVRWLAQYRADAEPCAIALGTYLRAVRD